MLYLCIGEDSAVHAITNSRHFHVLKGYSIYFWPASKLSPPKNPLFFFFFVKVPGSCEATAKILVISKHTFHEENVFPLGEKLQLKSIFFLHSPWTYNILVVFLFIKKTWIFTSWKNWSREIFYAIFELLIMCGIYFRVVVSEIVKITAVTVSCCASESPYS